MHNTAEEVTNGDDKVMQELYGVGLVMGAVLGLGLMGAVKESCMCLSRLIF